MKAKHIDVQYHYVRDHLEQRCIRIEFCPTTSMQADSLTKPVPADLVQKFL